MTSLILEFNQNWVFVFSYLIAFWLIIFFVRKRNKSKTEIKHQLVISLVAVGSGLVLEVLGTTVNLWHYVDGDIPLILILFYAVVGITGFQIYKFMEEHL